MSQNTEVISRKLSATEYDVHVRTNRPFWLIFSESYHPLWRAYLDDKEIEPNVAHFHLHKFLLSFLA